MRFEGNREGLPLLWLHGFMGFGDDWLHLVHDHFNDYCNILVDLPGHGKSVLSDKVDYPSVLHSLIEQLASAGIQKFVVIGYSMGGRTAIHLQRVHSENIIALIGLSTAPGLRTEQERQNRLDSDKDLMDKLQSIGFDDFLQDWYFLSLFKSIQKNENLLKNLIGSRSTQDSDQLLLSLTLLGNGALPSLWEHLKEIQCPVLLMGGALDEKYGKINEEMMEQLPHGQLAIIRGGDHAFHMEKPLETARVIRHFLREII